MDTRFIASSVTTTPQSRLLHSLSSSLVGTHRCHALLTARTLTRRRALRLGLGPCGGGTLGGSCVPPPGSELTRLLGGTARVPWPPSGGPHIATEARRTSVRRSPCGLP